MHVHNTELFLVNCQAVSSLKSKYNQYPQGSSWQPLDTVNSVIPTKVQEHEFSPEKDIYRQPPNVLVSQAWFYTELSCLHCKFLISSMCCWCAPHENPTGEVKSQGGAFGGTQKYTKVDFFYYLTAYWPIKNAQSNLGAPLSWVYSFFS